MIVWPHCREVDLYTPINALVLHMYYHIFLFEVFVQCEPKMTRECIRMKLPKVLKMYSNLCQ